MLSVCGFRPSVRPCVCVCVCVCVWAVFARELLQHWQQTVGCCTATIYLTEVEQGNAISCVNISVCVLLPSVH